MKTHPVSDAHDDHVQSLSNLRFRVHHLSFSGLLEFVRYFLICLDVARQRRQLLALEQSELVS